MKSPSPILQSSNKGFLKRMESTRIEQKFNDLNGGQQRSAELFLFHRFKNENVPLKDNEDVNKLLTEWNHSILLENGLMTCFSKSDSKTISKMVEDRQKSF